MVAYNGVQNQANDTTVKSDLRNFANKIMLEHASSANYPLGTGKTAPATQSSPSEPINFPVSQSSYATNVHNFVYCEGLDSSSQEIYAIGAVSKSGKKFAYYLNGGLKEYTGQWGTVAQICPGLGIVNPPPVTAYYYSYGYNGSSHTWFDWTE